MYSSDKKNLSNPFSANKHFQIKLEDNSSPTTPSIKRKFPSILHPINTDYIVETHYQAASFQNSFELLKKVIIDLAGDKEENCEFDIIVKKRKVVKREVSAPLKSPIMEKQKEKEKPSKTIIHQTIPDTFLKQENSPRNEEMPNKDSYSRSDSDSDSNEDNEEESLMDSEKKVPKIFGKAIFDLVLKNKAFNENYLQNNDFQKRSEEIFYPNDAEFNLNGFFQWIKEERLNEKYTIKVFLDIWNWRSCPKENWREKHYKYYLTKLMKIFFEQYAYNYIIHSNAHKENGKDFISFIPKFLAGIESPENFNLLKE